MVKAESNLVKWHPKLKQIAFARPQQAKWGFQGWLLRGFQAHSSHVMILGLFSHVDIGQGRRLSVMFFGFMVVFGPTLCQMYSLWRHASSKMSMQFPSSSLRKMSSLQQRRASLASESNSAWLQFQRFFPWPKGPCYFVWARVWTARMSWPLDTTWLAGPQGR